MCCPLQLAVSIHLVCHLSIFKACIITSVISHTFELIISHHIQFSFGILFLLLLLFLYLYLMYFALCLTGSYDNETNNQQRQQ